MKNYNNKKNVIDEKGFLANNQLLKDLKLPKLVGVEENFLAGCQSLGDLKILPYDLNNMTAEQLQELRDELINIDINQESVGRSR